MNTLFALDRESGLDLETALSLEWLETNGLGDYASSTVALCPTRRYHGLLVARPTGSEKRAVLLSRFEEELVLDGEAIPLSIARYGDGYTPRGDEQLFAFELAPGPRARYVAPDGTELVREILLVHGERTVLVRYRLDDTGTRGAELALAPFLPFRDADALTVRNDVADPRSRREGDAFVFQLYDALPALHFTASEPLAFAPDPTWYEGLDLPAERARGYEDREDQLAPGQFRLPLADEVVVAVSADGAVADPRAAWEREHARRLARFRRSLPKKEKARDARSPRARLAYGAEDFLIRTNGRLGVDAGYPWFGEWGRDTFLALPGLTLARGDVDACAEALSQSLEFLQDGLLPNVFGLTRATSHYGSVDAALWFARAVDLYARGGGDGERVRTEYLPALTEIATAYRDGTELGVRADAGGLLRAGSPELNATWMDARVAAGPVTPRDGCAVEINALWYSLLKQLEDLNAGDRSVRRGWRDLRLQVKRTFLERFWLEDEGYLADVWREDEVDASVRPNMVLAAALAHSPLKRHQRASVAARAMRDLLTPRGLRTLAPTDPAYRGRFEGGSEERDRAYHQGTAWPWLFGFLVEAQLRGAGTTRQVREPLRAAWNAIVSTLDEAGIGHVSEVFDGEVPQRPGGTIAQAWNTAELLRADRMLRRRRA